MTVVVQVFWASWSEDAAAVVNNGIGVVVVRVRIRASAARTVVPTAYATRIVGEA